MEDVYIVPVILLVVNLCSAQADHYGLLYGEDVNNPGQGVPFCMMYNPKFKSIPSERSAAAVHELKNLMPADMCEAPSSTPELHQQAAAVARGNCTFSEKARLIQKYDGSVALIISDSALSEPQANTSEDYNEINITVALMAKNDFDSLMTVGKIEDIRIQLYAPEPPAVDYNLIVIWLMAVGTVFLGALWSGHVKHNQYLKKHRRRKPDKRNDDADDSDDDEPEQETFDMTPKIVLVFVFMMCGMLLLLYFLYDYLVYVIIGMFALASSMALYSVLKPVLLRLKFIGNCRIPENNLPLLRKQPEIRRIFLAMLCVGLAVFWAIERNQSYAWIIQNIFGIVFCVHMMKTLRLPNLKACTILLVLLFVYDIFFVFVTPLLTKSGESVMVEVATGGSSSSGEMLPMVLKVPRFASSALSVCSLPYSLLGFGDILIPGLLISYCHGFDLKVQSGRIYLIANIIAYAVGLVICFVGMALMQTGQPALLYLVPCTLLTTAAIGAKRGELNHLWNGELKKKSDDVDKPSVQKTSSGRKDAQAAQNRDRLSVQAADDDSINSTDNEQQQLLNESH